MNLVLLESHLIPQISYVLGLIFVFVGIPFYIISGIILRRRRAKEAQESICHQCGQKGAAPNALIKKTLKSGETVSFCSEKCMQAFVANWNQTGQ